MTYTIEWRYGSWDQWKTVPVVSTDTTYLEGYIDGMTSHIRQGSTVEHRIVPVGDREVVG